MPADTKAHDKSLHKRKERDVYLVSFPLLILAITLGQLCCCAGSQQARFTVWTHCLANAGWNLQQYPECYYANRGWISLDRYWSGTAAL